MDLIGGVTSGQLGTILALKGFKKVKNNEYFDYYEPCIGMDRRCKKSFDFTTITLPSSNTLLKWGIVNSIMKELFEEHTFNYYFAVEYKFDTIFPAGDYKGKTLNEVLEVDIGYIEKCIFNVDYFFFFESILSPKSNKIERDYFFKMKKVYESFSAETREYYFKKKKSKAIFDKDRYDNYEPPVMPNQTYDYEDWLRDEFGDEAGAAYWNLD